MLSPMARTCYQGCIGSQNSTRGGGGGHIAVSKDMQIASLGARREPVSGIAGPTICEPPGPPHTSCAVRKEKVDCVVPPVY